MSCIGILLKMYIFKKRIVENRANKLPLNLGVKAFGIVTNGYKLVWFY